MFCVLVVPVYSILFMCGCEGLQLHTGERARLEIPSPGGEESYTCLAFLT
jgi:hypothetical protein